MTTERPIWPFTLNAHDIVCIAYRGLLGREPDPAGLAYWTNVIADAGDPTLVFQSVMASPEYLSRQVEKPDWTALGSRAHKLLGRNPRIVDIGAQTFDDHVYSALTSHFATEIIGFDPLDDRLKERERKESDSRLTLLPFAIGDGSDHLLHINNEDATSSLFGLDHASNRNFNHLSTLFTVDTRTVSTRCLDDVLPDQDVDFLKLDVQGAEVMALSGAARTLTRTAVVHCEVEFLPIYSGQPLFGDVDRLLRAAGFQFVDFPVLKRYRYEQSPEALWGDDHLIWADAVYFRETSDPTTLAAQALIAAVIYRKLSLADHLLRKGDQR